MFSFIIYELKVAVVLAASYLCFKCILSREKLHRLNRAVLIATAILSFVLPLCIITIHRTVPMPEFMENGAAYIEDAQQLSATTSGAFWKTLAIVVYLMGVTFVLGRISVGISRVMKTIRNGESMQMEGNEVIVCEGDVSPFSWLHWIVMSRADFESGNRLILEHEKAHIKLGHSKDVLLVDILSAFQWFNPAMWLLKSDLRAVHEYEADDAVLRGGANIKEYQYSLIRKAVSASGYSITNSFNHSTLKNRITMMSKSNASRVRGLKALYILPLFCGALALNARTVLDYESSEIVSNQQTPIKIEVKMENDKPVYYINGERTAIEKLGEKGANLKKDNDSAVVMIVVDRNVRLETLDGLKEELKKIDAQKVAYITVIPKENKESASFQPLKPKPTFNGMDATEFSKWVNANIVYPAEARAARKQGKVTVQFTVLENGKVSDVKVLRGIDPALDAEAIRVVSASPDWKPGEKDGKKVSVTYTFPVIFEITSSDDR